MSGYRKSSKHSIRAPSVSLTGTKAIATELDRIRQSEVMYKAKIRALEEEVCTLKYRLDILRKAKNTTIVRREREEIRISSPSLGRRQGMEKPGTGAHRVRGQTPSRPAQQQQQQQEEEVVVGGCLSEQVKELSAEVDRLNAQLLSAKASYSQLQEESRANHQSEVSTLKRLHREEVQRLTAKLEQELTRPQAKDDDSSEKLEALQHELEGLRAVNSDLSGQLSEVLASNEALRQGSLLLQEKSEALLEELSVKEAEWSQREDRLKEEIRKKWGERYHEWMTKAEKKMEELQQINGLLQTMLKTKEDNHL